MYIIACISVLQNWNIFYIVMYIRNKKKEILWIYCSAYGMLHCQNEFWPTRRVHPLTGVTHLSAYGRLTPQCVTLVSAERHRDLSALFVLTLPCSGLSGYSVSWNQVLYLRIANLFSGNLSRSQTTFRHSTTCKNRPKQHLLSNEVVDSSTHFWTDELLSPLPSPHL